VVRAFGGAPTPIPLAGGQGDAWRAGDVVVKPVHEPEEAAWCQRVIARVEERGFRVPRPIAADGAWVVNGWMACEYVDGLRGGQERLRDVLDAASRFHDSLPDPDEEARAVLGRRRHRWAIADRVAWCDATVDLTARAAELFAGMCDELEHCPDAPDPSVQLVHGDIGGNVCFDAAGTAVVLDFSPYIRPRRYPDAIAVVDAMLWRGGGPELVELLAGDETAPAGLLLHALAFRLVAEDLGASEPAPEDFDPFERVLEWLRITRSDTPSD